MTDINYQISGVSLAEDPTDSQVRGWYKKLMAQILELDEVLDAQMDAATGGRRKFTNELVTKYEGEWKPATDGMIEQMKDWEPDKLAGVLYGFLRTLTSQFKENTDKWIDKEVETQPKVEVETISEDEKKEVQEKRSELAKQVKAILEMAYTFGEATGNLDDNPDPQWPTPRIRRGSVGKRGKRALTMYTWAIDGQELDEDDNSVKGVSLKLGFEKSAEFTQALRDAKINTTSPDDEFTVEIRGKQVNGKRITEEEDAEEIETDPSEPEEVAS